MEWFGVHWSHIQEGLSVPSYTGSNIQWRETVDHLSISGREWSEWHSRDCTSSYRSHIYGHDPTAGWSDPCHPEHDITVDQNPILPVEQYNAQLSAFKTKMRELLICQGCKTSDRGERSAQGHLVVGASEAAEGEPPLADGVHLMDNPGQKRLYRSIRLVLYEAEQASPNSWQQVKGYCHCLLVLQTRLKHIRLN